MTSFETHEALLHDGGYSAALSLQDLVLNLWNGGGWKVDMGRLARNLDSAHWAIALDLLESYRRNGEGDAAFMAIAAKLAAQRHAETGGEARN